MSGTDRRADPGPESQVATTLAALQADAGTRAALAQAPADILATLPRVLAASDFVLAQSENFFELIDQNEQTITLRLVMEG